MFKKRAVQFRFVITLLFATMCFVAIASGAPTIGDISGQLQDGSTVTITGTGFGTKSPAKPWVWADFESGFNPTSLGTQTTWNSSENIERVTGPTNCPGMSGDGCLRSVYNPAYGGRQFSGVEVTYPGTSMSHKGNFVYSYRKERSNEDRHHMWCSNEKHNRNWQNVNANGCNFYYHAPANVYLGEACGIGQPNLGDGENDSCRWNNSARHDQTYRCAHNDTTYVWEILHEGNTLSPMTKDGTYIVYAWPNQAYSNSSCGGAKNIITMMNTSTTCMTCAQCDDPIKYTFIGIYLDGAFTPSTYFWYDDIYMDTTWQRVMVCTGSTWSSRGWCEIQIPSAWNNSSISIQVREGDLNLITGTYYLYVVDSNNSANANGIRITQGNPIIGIAPMPPTLHPAI